MNLISYEKFNYTGNENYLVTLAMLGTFLFMACANTLWVNIFTCFTLQEIGGLISGYLATRLIDNALLSSTYYWLSGDNQILLDLDDLRREKRHK